MSNEKNLLDQIDDLVASKTFNLDALDNIKKLKDDLKKTLDERDSLQRRYDGLYDTNTKQIEEIQRLTGRLTERAKQVDAMRDAVAKGNDAVWEKKIAEAGAAAYKDALLTVFKPNTVRETVYQSIPIAQNYNGNTCVTPYHQETKTTKEEV